MTKIFMLAVIAAIIGGGATSPEARTTSARQTQKRTRRARMTTRSKPPVAPATTKQDASTATEQPPVASAPVEDLTTDPASPVLDIAGEPTKGDKAARVVLIEFSDFECSYCGRYFAETYPRIDSDYVKTGKIKYVFRDLPLEAMHPNAFRAAEAAACAGEQGKFWEMHDRLFANQTALAGEDLGAHALAVKADARRFDACLTANRQADAIRADMDLARRLGITGTPSFLIGLALPRSTGVRIIGGLAGNQPFNEFKASLDEALRRAGAASTTK